MPLEAEGVYKLTNVGGNFLPEAMIAIAPRVRTDWSAVLDQSAPFVQFLVDNPATIGHSIAGKILLDDAGVVDVLDLEKTGDDGGAVIWRFEPLTVSLWETMRESIGGFDELRAQIDTDEVLRLYYMSSYAADWWTEDQ
jgi:hypothetical protein